MGTPTAVNHHLLNGVSRGTRIYLQRDFSEGTTVRFCNKFPSELVSLIDRDSFKRTIDKINSIFDEAERMSIKVFFESCLACITAYCIYACMDSHYDKCLKKISKYIAEQNDTVWRPRGLCITDPMDRGLRVIEITIFATRVDSSPATLPENTISHSAHHAPVAQSIQTASAHNTSV